MRRRVMGCGGLLLLGLVGLACLGHFYPANAFFQLGVGWALFLARVLPRLRINPAGVGLALVCLAALALGLHALLGRLYRRVAPPGGGVNSVWPARQTVAVLGLLVVILVAGISAVGVGHLAAWLATSPEPLIEDGSNKALARPRAMNNLRLMALGMNHYADRHGRLPTAAIHGKDGRPLLSWRVALLPFLDEEKLFAEFRLDEPWDSPHNLRLLPRMPEVYVSQTAQGPANGTATPFRVFTGRGTAFEGTRGLRIPDDFSDGTSRTLLIVEAAEAVPWTKPDELVYDPHGPLPGVGAGSQNAFAAVLADGSVLALPFPADEAALRALITRNAGDRVPEK